MRGQPLPRPVRSVDARLTALDASVGQPPTVAGRVRLTGQTAAIASSNVVPTLAPGLYRVSGSLRVTTVGTAGTISLVVAWTDDAQAESATLVSALSLTAKGQGNGSIVGRLASGTVAYSTSVAGLGVNQVYALDVLVERIGE